MTTSAELSERAAKIPPVCNQRAPCFPENLFPVDIAGFHLRGGRISPVRRARSTPQSVSAFGEIDAIAHITADTVERRPAYQVRIYPSL